MLLSAQSVLRLSEYYLAESVCLFGLSACICSIQINSLVPVAVAAIFIQGLSKQLLAIWVFGPISKNMIINCENEKLTF